MLFNLMLFKLKKFLCTLFSSLFIIVSRQDTIFRTQNCKRIEATRDVVLSTFNYYY